MDWAVFGLDWLTPVYWRPDSSAVANTLELVKVPL